LIDKNIKKNDVIKSFLKDELNITGQDWLFDSEWINTNIKIFCEKLGDELLLIYNSNCTDMNMCILKIEEFTLGISFNRIKTDYNMLSLNGKNLLKLIFDKIINKITKERLLELDNNIKLVQFMKFLIDMKL